MPDISSHPFFVPVKIKNHKFNHPFTMIRLQDFCKPVSLIIFPTRYLFLSLIN